MEVENIPKKYSIHFLIEKDISLACVDIFDLFFLFVACFHGSDYFLQRCWEMQHVGEGTPHLVGKVHLISFWIWPHFLGYHLQLNRFVKKTSFFRIDNEESIGKKKVCWKMAAGAFHWLRQRFPNSVLRIPRVHVFLFLSSTTQLFQIIKLCHVLTWVQYPAGSASHTVCLFSYMNRINVLMNDYRL